MAVIAEVGTVEAPFAVGDAEIVQFQTPGLGDSSYLLRSGDEAVIVDPQRDIDRFRRAIEERGVRLVAVVETHVHNDYVSGGPGLAGAYGAEYVVPADAGYELAHHPVRESDEVHVGTLVLRALHTPGHTPHHTSYEVVEGSDVRAIFSGGSVLVGSCGRSDLVAPEMTELLTREQYRSAQRIGALPGPTAIGPTHGAGSFCAASTGATDTWTTVTEERARNPAFLATGEDEFVRTQLAGLGAYPTYYRHMAPINRRGAPAWEPVAPPDLQTDDLDRLTAAGAIVIDGRSRHKFAAMHIPGSVNVELEAQFGGYLGWLYPFGTTFALVLGSAHDPIAAVRQTARIGIETIAGVISLETWRAAGRAVDSMPVVDAAGLHAAWQAGALVLDVRQDHEWREGHVPGATHIHVPDLPQRVNEMRGDSPVYTYCQSGYRAAMGASILMAAGIPAVIVDGGFGDWRTRGYPVVVAER